MRGRTGEQFPQDAQNDHPARPQRVKGRGVPSGYVEGLNDARMLLVGFFSILPGDLLREVAEFI
jgi:hypothetical protein